MASLEHTLRILRELTTGRNGWEASVTSTCILPSDGPKVSQRLIGNQSPIARLGEGHSLDTQHGNKLANQYTNQTPGKGCILGDTSPSASQRSREFHGSSGDADDDPKTSGLCHLRRELQLRKAKFDDCFAQRWYSLEEQTREFEREKTKATEFATDLLRQVETTIKEHTDRIVAQITQRQRHFEEALTDQILQLENHERKATECDHHLQKLCNDSTILTTKEQFRIVESGIEGLMETIEHRLKETTPSSAQCEFKTPSKVDQDRACDGFADLFNVLISDVPTEEMSQNRQTHVVLVHGPPREPTDASVLQDRIEKPFKDSILWSVLGSPVAGFDPGDFNDPRGVAVCAAARTICVADKGNHRIQIFDYDSRLLHASSPGEFKHPLGVACTPDGHFLVSELLSNRIQMIDGGTGRVLRTFGQTGSAPGCFRFPSGIAVDDTTRRVYICDESNHRVQVVGRDCEFLQAFGVKGTLNGQFDRPTDVAVAQGRVLVTDWFNNRLQAFSSTGKHLQTVDDYHVHNPWGIAANPAGDTVYVCSENGIAVYGTQPTVHYRKTIPSPVVGEHPKWIALCSNTEALVTFEYDHQVHKVKID